MYVISRGDLRYLSFLRYFYLRVLMFIIILKDTVWDLEEVGF